MRRCLALVLLLPSLQACQFDAALPHAATLRCVTQDDCPLPLVCSAERCVQAGDDVTPPTLAELAWPVASQRTSGIPLTLVASEPLDAAPVLAWQRAPQVTLLSQSDDNVTFHYALALSDAVSDGDVAVLSTVTLTDRANNIAALDVHQVLVLDRVAPPVENLEVAPRLVSSQGDGAAFRVTFVSDEVYGQAPTDAVVLFEGEPLACATQQQDNTRVQYSCAGSAVGVAGGVRGVSLLLADAAGNVTTASAVVEVDDVGPDGNTVVDALDPITGIQSEALFPGAVLRVRANAEVARVTGTLARDGELIPMSWQWSIAVAAFVAAVPTTLVPATYTLSLDLVDAVGNTRHHRQDWVARHEVWSRCVLRNADGEATCTDDDGDGFFGTSARCTPVLADCHDEDALTHPGALELPGDQRDNGCGAGASVDINDDTGVFVSPTGDDAGAGTRAAPVRHLDTAIAQAQARGVSGVYLLPGVHESDAAMDVVGPAPLVLVGVDAQGARTGLTAPPTLRLLHPVTSLHSAAAVAVDGIQLEVMGTGIAAPTITLRAVGVRCVDSEAGCSLGSDETTHLFGQQLSLADVALQASQVRFTDVRGTPSGIFAFESATLTRVQLEGSAFSGYVSADVVDISSSILTRTTVNSYVRVSLVGSVFDQLDSGAMLQAQGEVLLVNSVILADVMCAGIVDDLTMVGVATDAVYMYGYIGEETILFDMVEEDCQQPFCAEVHSNLLGTPPFVDNVYRVDQQSSLVAAGVEAGEYYFARVAMDLSGNCRSSPPTIGAQEYIAEPAQ